MGTEVNFSEKYIVTPARNTGNASQASESKPNSSVFNTYVEQNHRGMLYRDDYTIKNNGRTVAYVAVTDDGWGQDAELKIASGDNKGLWRFRDQDGDTINIGHFGMREGKLTCDSKNLQYLELWKDCNSDYTRNGDRKKNGQKYPIKKEENNILININKTNPNDPNSWIPLEQFAAMR